LISVYEGQGFVFDRLRRQDQAAQQSTTFDN